MIAEPVIHVLDVHSVVAFANGTATKEQQQRAFHWFLQEACQFSGTCPDDATERQAAIFEGRRQVGMLIMKMMLPGTLAAAQKFDAEIKPKVEASRKLRQRGPQ